MEKHEAICLLVSRYKQWTLEEIEQYIFCRLYDEYLNLQKQNQEEFNNLVNKAIKESPNV